MHKFSLFILLPMCATVGIASTASATTYTYDVGPDQTWSDGGTSSGTTTNVTVRSYVPGSHTTTYRTIPIYTPAYASAANASGDVVGSVQHIYGSGTTAFSNPFDGPQRTVIYPAVQILHTSLFSVNDDRIAIGQYNTLGGPGQGFLYDVIFDQFTEFNAPNTEWTALRSINNFGTIVGVSINNGGADRTGFVYDCATGFQPFHIPGSGWTVPQKIDDQGNIYGYMSGIVDAMYFVATPDSVDSAPGCSLVARDDVATPLNFAGGTSFEIDGDVIFGIRVADYDGGGVDDILGYNQDWRWTLYTGESGFNDTVDYGYNGFPASLANVPVATAWDFNNDGVLDEVTYQADRNLVNLSNSAGGFHYVPQELPQDSHFGDFNGDGLVDYFTVNGVFIDIVYQTTGTPAAPDPGATPNPTPPPPAGSTGNGPGVDANATKVELADTITSIGQDHVVLSSGATLWFDATTIIKYNDASGFAVGQTLEFKAWQNANGDMVGIKVEVV